MADIPDLSLEERAALARMLLVESGSVAPRVQVRAEHVDLHASGRPLWRERPLQVRVFDRAITQDDVDELIGVATADGLADAVIIEGAHGGASLSTRGVAEIMSAEEFVERLRASPLISWKDGRPRAEAARYEEWSDLNRSLAAHDPLGLRWLPTLALNKIPPDLFDIGDSADRLFERIAFRVMTTVFRFGGFRLGEKESGKRVPDSVLLSPCAFRDPYAALLDCKAAGSGYTMSTADIRAQVEYATTHRQLAERAGHRLTHLLIVSSSFGGDFSLRAGELREQADVQLCYLRAADVVRLAIAIEAAEEPTAGREAIDWPSVFNRGQPSGDDLLEALERGRDEIRSASEARPEAAGNRGDIVED